MESDVLALRVLVAAVLVAISRPPVHLHVDHLETDQITFQVGDFAIETLSGELNIGLNLKVGADSGPGGQESSPGGADGAARQLWPPLTTEMGEKG